MKEDDPLWNLLGRARPPREASPYFAQNVLRDLPSRRGFWARCFGFGTPGGSLLPRWAAASALLALCGAGLWFFAMPEPTDFPVAAGPEPIEFDLLVELDYLIAHEESTLWLDTF